MGVLRSEWGCYEIGESGIVSDGMLFLKVQVLSLLVHFGWNLRHDLVTRHLLTSGSSKYSAVIYFGISNPNWV